MALAAFGGGEGAGLRLHRSHLCDGRRRRWRAMAALADHCWGRVVRDFRQCPRGGDFRVQGSPSPLDGACDLGDLLRQPGADRRSVSLPKFRSLLSSFPHPISRF